MSKRKQKLNSFSFSHPFTIFFIGVVALAMPLMWYVIEENQPKVVERQTLAAFAEVDPASGNPAPSGPTGDWHLIFSDEFNGTTLDLSKWIMCNSSFASSCNPYNNEQEKYNVALTNNANVQVNSGQLHLIATKDANGQIWSGMVATGPNKFNYAQPDYKSFQFTYGYYEGKVKFPKGNGFWPSMWMLPDQDTYGPWPDSGEYDVIEIAGNDPAKGYFTAHWGPVGSGECGHPCTPQEAPIADASADYHTYGFDWAEDGLTWYVDGKQMGDKITDPAAIRNTPFYIIANFSVGGSWPPLNGGPDSSTVFPASMAIDYLRVWQKGPAPLASPTPAISATAVPTAPQVSPTYGSINDCMVNGTCPSPTVIITPDTVTPTVFEEEPTGVDDGIDTTPVVTQIPDDNDSENGDRKGFIALPLQLLAAISGFFASLFEK